MSNRSSTAKSGQRSSVHDRVRLHARRRANRETHEAAHKAQHLVDLTALADLAIQEEDAPACVAAHKDDYASDCSTPAAEALYRDALRTAAEASADPRVSIVDLTDTVCMADLCPAVIGGVLAYRDRQHLTSLFARTLAPILDERLAG